MKGLLCYAVTDISEVCGVHTDLSTEPLGPREGYLPIGRTRLYFRDIGQGHPIIILHGGPDFDHSYLLPEMDQLAGSFRLIYYDQRGRGRSGEGVDPEDVSLRSEIDDLEEIRRLLHFESVALLGHSWGAVLAMEYAASHANRVSHLILMNSAPASRDDYLLLRQHLADSRPAGDTEKMQAIASSAAYHEGDLATEAAYYRIHFTVTVRQSELLERIIRRLRLHFTEADVLLARAIEQRLYDETWWSPGYDLLPKLRELTVPMLIIHGEDDLVPVEAATHIARAAPAALLHVVPGCGHFVYLESPDQVQDQIAAFIATVNDRF